MKQSPTMTANPLTRIAEAWSRFWFAPGSPTTLGLIRLCAGLITVYVHLVYSYDLFQFFGKDAWLSTERVLRNRADSPWIAPSNDWMGLQPTLYVPEDVEMREALFQWLRGLPDDKDERLRFIDYIYQIKPIPEGTRVPGFILALPEGAAAGMEPTSPEYYPQGFTKWQVARFIKNLPEDKNARLEKLAYMQEWNFDPDQVYRRGGYYWSVWFHVTDPTWMVITHVGILVVMLMFAVGFCTRVTSVLTWLAALSYIQRSPITLFGVDTMMNVLLIYLMVGPSGEALSVDRWLAHWWKTRKARSAGKAAPPWTAPAPSVSANFAIRMIQVHFCIIYLASGTTKLMGGNWWNGTAVYYTMANYEFAPLRRAYYLSFMHWLAENRWLWEIVITAGSFGTLALEIGLPFLVWQKRFRPVMVACSMMLHVSIALFMGLVAFSLLMATMVLSFIPGDAIERLLGWARRRVGLKDMVVETPMTPQLKALAPAGEAEEMADTPAGETEPVLQVVGQPETGITLDKDKPKRKKEKSA
jgi:hypothetical protein